MGCDKVAMAEGGERGGGRGLAGCGRGGCWWFVFVGERECSETGQAGGLGCARSAVAVALLRPGVGRAGAIRSARAARDQQLISQPKTTALNQLPRVSDG